MGIEVLWDLLPWLYSEFVNSWLQRTQLLICTLEKTTRAGLIQPGQGEAVNGKGIYQVQSSDAYLPALFL